MLFAVAIDRAQCMHLCIFCICTNILHHMQRSVTIPQMLTPKVELLVLHLWLVAGQI